MRKVLIEKNKKMLLFRFNNYKKTSFIAEHKKVLDNNGHVWMLKIGKKTSLEKINSILKDGGWIVLRAPKADGSVNYMARFTELSEEMPKNEMFPKYYNAFLDGDDSFEYDLSSEQWFKLDYIAEIPKPAISNLVLEKSHKKIDEVIGTTRTAVMFVTSESDIVF